MIKKILFYTDTPIYGGAEKQMISLARLIDKQKYEIHLASFAYPQLRDWQEQFTNAGFKIWPIKAMHKHDPRNYFAIKNLIQKEKYKLIHCHVWNPASCRYAIQAAKATKTPIITTEHDPFALSSIKDLIKKYQLNFIDKIICISQSNLDFLSAQYPFAKRKLTLIHNGLDIEGFFKKLEDSSKTSKLKTGDQKLITCIAALHERKGVDILLNAFNIFSKNNPSYQLAIAGIGPDQQNLEQLTKNLNIADRVHFLGHVENIPQLLKNSDYFVLPSRREAFGLVLLEAMCAKLPILATKTGGITEILSKQEAVLVEPNNIQQLADGLNKLVTTPSEARAQMCRSAFQKLTTQFSVKKMAENTEKVYDQHIQ